MHVLFTTTVDASYSTLFTTWLTLFLYSLSTTVTKDLSRSGIEYSLAVGCMPSAHVINDGRPANRRVELPAGLNCTHINNIPGFDLDGKKHHKQFFVSYPDVRRTMMIKAFASTGQYDMIVYSDVDAFIVRNPMVDLLQYWSSNFSAIYSREHFNTSFVCNGYYALFDMNLPKQWIHRGIYSQNEVNNWIASEHKDVDRKFYSSFDMQGLNGNGTARIGLLPEIEYFRGGCGTLMSPTRKVEHCHSKFFNGKEKLRTFLRLNRTIAAGNEEEQVNVVMVLTSAIFPSKKGKLVSDFVYQMRDQKRKSNGSEYSMELHSHRLKVSTSVKESIERLPRWKDLQRAYQL